MKLNPLNDRIVIEPIEQPAKTEHGLFLPENTQDRPQTGKVLATGPGRFEDGGRTPIAVPVGATVLFAKYSGTEVKLDGKKIIILRESDILAVVT